MPDRLRETAVSVVESWRDWCDADGWDNKEYDRLASALTDLANELGVKVSRFRDEV